MPKIQLKHPEQINAMRTAGKLVGETLQLLAEAVKPGITTAELDALAEAYIRKHGGIPAYKGYRGFPATICASINETIVHGIPSDRALKPGDIISLDVGAKVKGYFGDATITVPVGDIDAESTRLVEVCRTSLKRGIDVARAGNRLTDIAGAIQPYVESNGFSVVRDLYGHGIGRQLHEDPLLPHYGPAGRGPLLRSGIVITIEPMITAGKQEWRTMPDQWTVVTLDGSRAAQFEHTVAITDNGPEILTVP